MTALDGTVIEPGKAFELRPVVLARHLGRVVRWAGSVSTYWSVLQHSLLVSMMAEADGLPPVAQLWGLLHDGHEFITGDWPRPWKIAAVGEKQDEIDIALEEALGLLNIEWTGADKVSDLDDEALVVEAMTVAPRARLAVMRDRPAPTEDHAAARRALVRRLVKADVGSTFIACWDAEGEYVMEFVRRFDRLVADSRAPEFAGAALKPEGAGI